MRFQRKHPLHANANFAAGKGIIGLFCIGAKAATNAVLLW